MSIKLTPKESDQESSLTEEETKINTMNEIASKIQNVKFIFFKNFSPKFPI